jgi:hypothetical protein
VWASRGASSPTHSTHTDGNQPQEKSRTGVLRTAYPRDSLCRPVGGARGIRLRAYPYPRIPVCTPPPPHSRTHNAHDTASDTPHIHPDPPCPPPPCTPTHPHTHTPTHPHTHTPTHPHTHPRCCLLFVLRVGQVSVPLLSVCPILNKPHCRFSCLKFSRGTNSQYITKRVRFAPPSSTAPASPSTFKLQTMAARLWYKAGTGLAA